MRDAGLVRRILDGDKRAAEFWVAESYPGIQRMLWCLTGNSEATEDLTQQAFIKAWEALADFRGEARLNTWLRRIAYREYTHWLRDKRTNASLTDIPELVDPRAYQDLSTVLLDRALAQLPEEMHDTFLLHHAQGLGVRDIALLMEVPVGTVKSRLFTARTRLRELIADTSVEPGAATPAGLPVL